MDGQVAPPAGREARKTAVKAQLATPQPGKPEARSTSLAGAPGARRGVCIDTVFVLCDIFHACLGAKRQAIGLPPAGEGFPPGWREGARVVSPYPGELVVLNARAGGSLDDPVAVVRWDDRKQGKPWSVFEDGCSPYLTIANAITQLGLADASRRGRRAASAS